MRAVAIAVIALALAGCVNTAENVTAAGFKSADEAAMFVPDFIFYAQQLTPDEWREFYARFPEYFKDVQEAKALGGSIEFHPWYTAFAFRWTTDRRRASWPADVVARLARGDVRPGDDVFMIVSALGPPPRVAVSNQGTAMAYPNGVAHVVRGGRLAATVPCAGCSQKREISTPPAIGMTDDDVIAEVRRKLPGR